MKQVAFVPLPVKPEPWTEMSLSVWPVWKHGTTSGLKVSCAHRPSKQLPEDVGKNPRHIATLSTLHRDEMGVSIFDHVMRGFWTCRI